MPHSDLLDIVDQIDSSEDFSDVITTIDDDGVGAVVSEQAVYVEPTITEQEAEVVSDLQFNDVAPKVDEVVEKVPSKKAQARVIFQAGQKAKLARKDIIKQFISEIGLTQAGAATYYQSLTKE